MQSSNKHTVPNNNTKMKRKQFAYVSPFECYNNNLTKQRNPSYMVSSHRKTNRSMLDFDETDNPRTQLCLKHSQGLNWVCFTCGFGVYCSQCMLQSHNKGLTKNHSRQQLSRVQYPSQSLYKEPQSLTNSPLQQQQSKEFHDIRPIQKSYNFIKNSLIQCQIHLQAKCNILTNMNEQLHNEKIQLYNQKNEYKIQLQRQFEYLYQVLRQKQEQMCNDIERIFLQNQKRCVGLIEDIKQLQQYYDQCQHSIGSVLQSQHAQHRQMNNANTEILATERDTQLHTCLFYSQHSNTIEQLLSDEEIETIKSDIYSINYRLQNHNLNAILKYISELELGYEKKFVYQTKQNSKVKEFQIAGDQGNDSPKKEKQLNKVKSEVILMGRSKADKRQNKKLNNNAQRLQQVQKNTSLKNLHSTQISQMRVQKQRQSHKQNSKNLPTSTPKALSRQHQVQFLKKSPQNNLLKKRKKSNIKMVSMPASPAKQDKQERTFSPINKARDLMIEGMKKKTTILKKKK